MSLHTHVPPAVALNGQAPPAVPETTPRPVVLDRRLWREALACFRPYRWTSLLTALAISPVAS